MTHRGSELILWRVKDIGQHAGDARAQGVIGADAGKALAEGGLCQVERALEGHLDDIVSLPPPVLQREATRPRRLVRDGAAMLKGVAALLRDVPILLVAIPVEAM